MNKWVIEQIKPETSLEAKMTEVKMPYFGHIMRRHASLEKTIVLGKIGGSKKTGRPTMRWIGSMKEGIDRALQELSRAGEDRTLWMSLIHRLPWVSVASMTCNTHILPFSALPARAEACYPCSGNRQQKCH